MFVKDDIHKIKKDEIKWFPTHRVCKDSYFAHATYSHKADIQEHKPHWGVYSKVFQVQNVSFLLSICSFEVSLLYFAEIKLAFIVDRPFQ